jgi:hypothetical protein
MSTVTLLAMLLAGFVSTLSGIVIVGIIAVVLGQAGLLLYRNIRARSETQTPSL